VGAPAPVAPDSAPSEATASGLDTDAGEPAPDSQRQKEEVADEVYLRGDEDPLAEEQSKKQIEQRQAEEALEPVPEPEEAFSWGAYGSARIRYRYTDSDNQIWGDGGSRIGLRGRWNYQPRSSLFSLVEYGFDLMDSVDNIFNPGGTASDRGRAGSFFPRLLYAGWETPNNVLTFGKNWSAYYQVAGWTDRMQGAGGSALGVYNAQTDGGPTGTGRADTVLQTRLTIDFLPERWFEPFGINVQVQEGRPIPQTESLDYGMAAGVSTIAEFANDYFAGFALNYARVDDAGSPEARAVNLRGSAYAYTLGLRKFTDDWYLALGGARLLNHETTDEGIYFNGWGGEFYVHRRVAERLWLGGGFNVLQPDADQIAAQDFDIGFGLLEMRYSVRGFSRMIFLNYRLEESRLQSGQKVPDLVTVGVRWDFP
jgi:predicted porin